MSTTVHDYHLNTLLHNIEFDRYMCQAYGVEWRWEMPAWQQRMKAKRWNYLTFYGIGVADLEATRVGQ